MRTVKFGRISVREAIFLSGLYLFATFASGCYTQLAGTNGGRTRDGSKNTQLYSPRNVRDEEIDKSVKATEEDSTNVEALYACIVKLSAVFQGYGEPGIFGPNTEERLLVLTNCIERAARYPSIHDQEISTLKAELYNNLLRWIDANYGPKYVKIAVRLCPDRPEAFARLGSFYWYQDDTINAGSNYHEAVILGWTDYWIGAYDASKEVPRAIALGFYKQSIQAFQEADYANTYRLSDSAIFYASKVSRLDLAEMYSDLGEGYLNAGVYLCSINAYRKALELDSTDWYRRRCLATALMEYGRTLPLATDRQEKLIEAAEIFRGLISKYDEDYDLYEDLAKVYGIMGDSTKVNEITSLEESKKEAKEEARQKESQERERANIAASKRRNERIRKAGFNLCSIPGANPGSDFWWFRRTIQFQGWIDASSYAISDAENFRVVTPSFAGEWTAVSIFRQSDQELVGAIQYAPFKNNSDRSSLIRVALMAGANCPPGGGFFQTLEDAELKQSDRLRDEDGTLRKATIYSWNSDDLIPGVKTLFLQIAVLEPSGDKPGEVAYWRDDTRIEK